MKQAIILVISFVVSTCNCLADDKNIKVTVTPEELLVGGQVHIECGLDGEWKLPLRWAKIVIRNGSGERILRTAMNVEGEVASYDYKIPEDEVEGIWKFKCVVKDQVNRVNDSQNIAVSAAPSDNPPDVDVEPPQGGYLDSPIEAHNTIMSYEGPATCLVCHQKEAGEMLNSLHMQWSGPTPDLTNSGGQELGKSNGGINTFCTYAMSSKAACFSCHVRGDGNAPHPAQAEDVDCLMCHSDTYQRKFVVDPENTKTVININGIEKTYQFGREDEFGNYTTEPDYDKMTPGTSMVNVARTVHMPTNASCLRCHAKAGGGDWTKRGDMGMSSVDPPVEEDVHLSKKGAALSCVNCHSALNHKISGRGIDLRQTEAPRPTCQACHTSAPHQDTTLNRHAKGQVGCQVCHIREYAKGGETEMSRDWLSPVWNQAFCSGQGGFVGEEVKKAYVQPEYVWFDGTSYVYNIGETIELDERGILPMAKAHGSPFDGKSSIVPIKRHSTNMARHESGQIVTPSIMWMFMTGDFHRAVEEGMQEQNMAGRYTIVAADAEMLITHGVEPKENAPACSECHDDSGSTPDGEKMLPLAALGYHNIAASVNSCTLCHEKKSLGWKQLHAKHREDDISCVSCHSGEPSGFTEPQSQLCSSCHEKKSWKDEGHKKHLEKGYDCVTCHTFS